MCFIGVEKGEAERENKNSRGKRPPSPRLWEDSGQSWDVSRLNSPDINRLGGSSLWMTQCLMEQSPRVSLITWFTLSCSTSCSAFILADKVHCSALLIYKQFTKQCLQHCQRCCCCCSRWGPPPTCSLRVLNYHEGRITVIAPLPP